MRDVTVFVSAMLAWIVFLVIVYDIGEYLDILV